VTVLVSYEEFSSIDEARARERTLKRGTVVGSSN
jgi:predicted GIY-YIG superfamily endonuclease